ncbi:MAG: hypothetical protein ACYSVY_27055, partial [Planctomycetota bacterium]
MRNLTRITENKKDDSAILEFLMWRQMTRAHDDYLLNIRSRLKQLEGAAQNAGFKSLADAQAQLSGHGGKALTQTVSVTIGGKQVELTMGQALWFAAIDAETEAFVVAGVPLM